MSEIQEAMAKMRTDRPDGLAVEVALTIRLHRNGAMSVEGPTGDPKFCKQMLDEAWDAIKRNHKPDRPALIVPAGDVEARPKEAYL